MKGKFLCLMLLSFVVTACQQIPHDSPEIQREFKQARLAVDDCLTKQIVGMIGSHDDPEIVAKVAANRCEYTALKETKRLKELNTSKGYIEGYTNRMTDLDELESQALNIILLLIQEAKN